MRASDLSLPLQLPYPTPPKPQKRAALSDSPGEASLSPVPRGAPNKCPRLGESAHLSGTPSCPEEQHCILTKTASSWQTPFPLLVSQKWCSGSQIWNCLQPNRQRQKEKDLLSSKHNESIMKQSSPGYSHSLAHSTFQKLIYAWQGIGWKLTPPPRPRHHHHLAAHVFSSFLYLSLAPG